MYIYNYLVDKWSSSEINNYQNKADWLIDNFFFLVLTWGDGTHDFIKTGMTGKVEITIDELNDVLYVPIQSVVSTEEKTICYVMTDKGPEERDVVTGLFDDDFVEIKNGLNKGERVMLNPPRWDILEPVEEE